MPLPPDLGRSEHATGTALVTERSLTSTVSTAAGDTRDTSDSTAWRVGEATSQHTTPSYPPPLYPFSFFLLHPSNPRPNSSSVTRTGTPRLGRSLFTSLLAHSIRLSLVLGHTAVDLPVITRPSAPIPLPQKDNKTTIKKISRLFHHRHGFEVCILDNIGPNGRQENGRQGMGSPGGLTLRRGDGNGRARSHIFFSGRRCAGRSSSRRRRRSSMSRRFGITNSR